MYDLIGDVHGQARELTLLLEILGYDRRRGYYSHPERKVIFLGDWIDRGPQIGRVLSIVRPMVEAGAALAVLGNHELNALAYHTRLPDSPGQFARRHIPKNIAQHEQTLLQLTPSELHDHLEWFRTIPLWLELDGLRVVHACWSPSMLKTLKTGLETHGGLTTAFLAEAYNKGTPLFEAVETVLKGKEATLPDGVTIADKDGHRWNKVRIKWYLPSIGLTYVEASFPEDLTLPQTLLAEGCACDEPYPDDAPPVFIGHYWLKGGDHPAPLAGNVACLDYSVARGGHLVAYRWDGIVPLTDEKFHSVATLRRDAAAESLTRLQ